MDNGQRGQVIQSAAEVYEAFFIPALFAPWPPLVADAAAIRAGQRVLDVACGTGILTRTVAERVGETGAAVGLDVNTGMLAVAARHAADIEWREGAAEALPFEDHSFDAVVSQFGLMFFEDQRAAVREMVRVLRPGGRLAVAVWDTLDNTPGYAAMVALLQRLFGEQVANGLRAPYSLGDLDTLRAVFSEAGFPDVEITTKPGQARFPSLRDWMYTDIKGWVLADALDEAQFQTLLREAQSALAPFVTPAGDVIFDAPGHIVTLSK